MSDPKKIVIVGQEGEHDWTKIAKAVVKIKNEYYMRNDPSLIRLRNQEGKFRFFRKDSKLIIKDPVSGDYILKSDCIKTEDGILLDKNSPDVVKIDGKFYRKAYVVNIGNKNYLKTDPLITRLSECGGYELIENTVTLSQEVYGKSSPIVVRKNDPNIIETSLGLINKRDATLTWDFKENKTKYVPTKTLGHGNYSSVTYEFQDKTNPQDDRLLNCVIDHTGYEKMPTVAFPISPRHTITIPESLVPYFTKASEDYIMPRYLSEIDRIKKSINKNFSDLDENENTAKDFKIIEKPFAGKQNIHHPDSYPKIVRGTKFSETGGLRYSFGIEFETSQGLVPTNVLTKHNILAVGDRSVGSAEYVTSPLQGNEGVERVKLFCKELGKYVLVDDRCGIHVHVGTVYNPTEKNPNPRPKDAPSFSKKFLINSVNLGCYLEEEIFSSMPKNRKPDLYHCHSIRRYEGVTEENFASRLGHYIFGPKELWYSEDKKPIKPSNFEDYKIGRGRDHTTNVGTWAEGRYKWLNLIHSYTRSNHKTIEFRIYSATTVFEKVRAYLLTSLAFTYVADNKDSLIKKGVTLSDVFNAAYKDHPEIIKFLNDFYAERKDKFKRKDLYPKNHPYLTLS